MATRSTPWAAWACRAATAALLKKQKPIGVAASAWWPGGLVATKALSTRRVTTSSTANVAPPAERNAASKVPGDIAVSESSWIAPWVGLARWIAST